MNKTITINLAGFNFYMDELAYLRLDKYLKAISASLEPESKEETMKDIEARIAELFLEKQRDRSQVIGMAEVDYIIQTLGQPEDFTDGEPEKSNEENTGKFTTTSKKTIKKLYRDVEHRTFGGICAGLAHYIGVERIWVRLIFLLLFLPIFTFKFLIPSGSTIFLIYIIMWIVVPAARTTSQKLEMEGEKIDIDNIERKVKAEYQNIKKKVNDTDYSDVQGFLEKLGNILVGFLKILVTIIGVAIVIVAGVSLISVLVSILSLGAISIAGFASLNETALLNTSFPTWLNYILIAFIAGIPLLLLLFAGLKIINPKSKPISLTGILILAGVWVLALIPFFFYQPIRENFNKKKFELKTTSETPLEVKDTLYLKPSTKVKGKNTNNMAYSSNISFSIEPEDSINLIKTRYFLRLYSSDYKPSGKIDYKPDIRKDTVLLDLFSKIHTNAPLIDEESVEGDIRLNGSLVFKIDKNLSPVITNLKEDFFDHFLQFKDGKIVCVDCSKRDSIHQKGKTDRLKQEADSLKVTEDNQDEWYQEKNLN